MKVPLIQTDTCRTCGLPFGSPEPQSARSRSYCQRCANLPQDVMAVLEVHEEQLREKVEQVQDPVPTLDHTQSQAARKR